MPAAPLRLDRRSLLCAALLPMVTQGQPQRAEAWIDRSRGRGDASVSTPASGLIGSGSSTADPTRDGAVVLPRHLSAIDPQLNYVKQLVDLALTKAGRRRELRFFDLEMAQGRSLAELSMGQSAFDLMWTVTDLQRERSGLIPVRFPIDRGLMGWRLLLVRKREEAQWRAVRSLQALRQRVAGQGHDWPDTAVLKANRLPVATSSHYDALFRMLSVGRFDYFPRSILEVDAELAGNAHPDLCIAPDLMLHYPTAAYLFVSPRRPGLAADLTRGLDVAAADGSFQSLHQLYYGPLLRAHAGARRHVIRLDNPLLPPETPLTRKALWLQPDQPG